MSDYCVFNLDRFLSKKVRRTSGWPVDIGGDDFALRRSRAVRSTSRSALVAIPGAEAIDRLGPINRRFVAIDLHLNLHERTRSSYEQGLELLKEIRPH